jgi:nucleotide-binding universal stress UspA family protein
MGAEDQTGFAGRQRAECPMIKRVLVPIDESDAAEDILPVVGMLAAGGGVLRLVHVAPIPQNIVTAEGRTVAYSDQEMARIQASWSDALRDTATRVHGAVDHVVRFGDPVAEILTEAEAFGADTIVVTTSTRSSVKRALLGSVAEAMLRRARIGVLMYRPPRDA